ncbi:protein SINE3-like [Abrus precatorius]|uniref:Protein SINE3-like n=1 Tax=Abrus precatorius TaxID=3816 RepID=A0A8B8MJ02_ABRPR|nr:protein SINE3-like [Abrus precatorius]
MKENQTPQKTYARSSEKRNRRLRPSPNFNKTTNKCLNAAFTSVSEDFVDFSPVCEISCADRNEDDTISLLEEASPKALIPSDISPSKKNTDTEEAKIDSIDCLNAYELDTFMEAEIAAISLIKDAKPEVFNSCNAAPQYRKLMDEITKYVIEDPYRKTVPEDFDRVYQVLSAKNRMLFLRFCIWIIGVLAIIFFTSDIHCPYSGPFPS